ncbi:MAG: BON domain-containing protein [Pelagibacteraceae bacterium]|nr:BON domain-containing protein [Pelagibacteraceae bacterium]
MKNNILLLVLLLSSINILSCSPAGILASGGATGMVVAEGDRSFGTVVDDATIKINIASKFINSDDNLFIDVGTNVLEGRVLLTGLVDNQEIRIDAVRRVWDVEGVNEVINEIQIGNRESIKEYAQDLWITTQVRGLAAKTIGLRSISYNFETIQGKVYIAGITSRADQLEELVKVAKTVKGVTEIINYVIIKE